MKNVDSVLQFADSAIIGRINYEMRKVLENISNPNTDEKTRKLTIEMDFTPINSRREISTLTDRQIYSGKYTKQTYLKFKKRRTKKLWKA